MVAESERGKVVGKRDDGDLNSDNRQLNDCIVGLALMGSAQGLGHALICL